ncbi:hypothetical protein Patl1_07106 [Pistacia atlantica]|uniref:Uncharacterized protein n=1 Tax=Pistacia atlantica TaxID=434234 RepID=A0ACC1AG24_9ROSI|nr:hypothetical protein Patl1_07106 [Pistacia atlantica]
MAAAMGDLLQKVMWLTRQLGMPKIIKSCPGFFGSDGATSDSFSRPHRDLSVQDYYSSFLTLWNDDSDLVTLKAYFGELLREAKPQSSNIMEHPRVASNTSRCLCSWQGEGS